MAEGKGKANRFGWGAAELPRQRSGKFSRPQEPQEDENQSKKQSEKITPILPTYIKATEVAKVSRKNSVPKRYLSHSNTSSVSSVRIIPQPRASMSRTHCRPGLPPPNIPANNSQVVKEREYDLVNGNTSTSVQTSSKNQRFSGEKHHSSIEAIRKEKHAKRANMKKSFDKNTPKMEKPTEIFVDIKNTGRQDENQNPTEDGTDLLTDNVKTGVDSLSLGVGSPVHTVHTANRHTTQHILDNDKGAPISVENLEHKKTRENTGKGHESVSVSRETVIGRPLQSAAKIRQAVCKRKEIDGSSSVLPRSTSVKKVASQVPKPQQSNPVKRSETKGKLQYSKYRPKTTKRDSVSGTPIVLNAQIDKNGKRALATHGKGRGENVKKSSKEQQFDNKCDPAQGGIDSNGNVEVPEKHVIVGESQGNILGRKNRGNVHLSSLHSQNNTELVPKVTLVASKCGKNDLQKSDAKEIASYQKIKLNSGSNKSVNKLPTGGIKNQKARVDVIQHSDTNKQWVSKRPVSQKRNVNVHLGRSNNRSRQHVEGYAPALPTTKLTASKSDCNKTLSRLSQQQFDQEKVFSPSKESDSQIKLSTQSEWTTDGNVPVCSVKVSSNTLQGADCRTKPLTDKSVSRLEETNTGSHQSLAKNAVHQPKYDGRNSLPPSSSPIKQESKTTSTNAKLSSSLQGVSYTSDQGIIPQTTIEESDYIDNYPRRGRLHSGNGAAGTPNEASDTCTNSRLLEGENVKDKNTKSQTLPTSVDNELANTAGGKPISSKLPISRSSSFKSIGTADLIKEGTTCVPKDNRHSCSIEETSSYQDVCASDVRSEDIPPRSEIIAKLEKLEGRKSSLDSSTSQAGSITGTKLSRYESGLKKLANLARHFSQQWNKPRAYIHTRQEPRQTKSDTTLLQVRQCQKQNHDILYGYAQRDSNKYRSLFGKSKQIEVKPSNGDKGLSRGQSEKNLFERDTCPLDDNRGQGKRDDFKQAKFCKSSSVLDIVKQNKSPQTPKSDKAHLSPIHFTQDKDKSVIASGVSSSGRAVSSQLLSYIPTRSLDHSPNLRKELTLEFIDAELSDEERSVQISQKQSTRTHKEVIESLSKDVINKVDSSTSTLHSTVTLISEIDTLNTALYSSTSSIQMPNSYCSPRITKENDDDYNLKGFQQSLVNSDDVENVTDSQSVKETLTEESSKDTTMPFGCGNKVAMADVEGKQEKQVTIRRGASCPVTSTSRLKAKENAKSVRPKSADFEPKTVNNKSCDIPCFRKTHARSPSDGTLDIVELIGSYPDSYRKTVVTLEDKGSECPKADHSVKTVESYGTSSTMTFQKASRRDIRVTVTPSSPKSPSLLHKVFSLKRTPRHERETEHKSQQTPEASSECGGGEAPCSAKDLEQEKKPSRDMSIKLKRYHSLSRTEGCQTPPLAVFSSTEDIASLPQTPKQEDSPLLGMSSSAKSSSQAEEEDDTISNSSSHARTISPELEEEISKLLLEPPKYKSYQPPENDTGSLPSLQPKHTSCHSMDTDTEGQKSPSTIYDYKRLSANLIADIPVTKTYAGYLQKKYATLRHHSAELYSPITASFFTTPVNTPGIAVTTSRTDTSVTYSAHCRKMEQVRRRHYTVDIPYMTTTTCVTKNEDLTSTCVAVTCFPDAMPTVVTAVPSLPIHTCCTSGMVTSVTNANRSREKLSGKPTSIIGLSYKQLSLEEATTAWNETRGDLGELPEQLFLAEVASTDSGIQQDETPSSSESFKLQTQLENLVARQGVCLASPGVSPRNSPERHGRERPKSDCLTVRWADSISHDLSSVERRKKRIPMKERPKSDLGGRRAVSEALQLLGADSHSNSTCTTVLPELPNLNPIQPLSDKKHIKSRRMSTPSPIKSRSVRSPPSKLRYPKKQLRKSKSAPDLLETCSVNTCNISTRLIHACSEAGDLAGQPHNTQFSSDDEASEDGMSLAASETSSASSSGKQNLLDELFEEQFTTFAEALWDHVTMDAEELAFGAGDVVEVTDQSDKDWWWGRIHKREGWFPAAFVRMRANQSETADDLAQKVKDGAIDTHTALLRYSHVLLSKDQARTNVIKEIIHAEREYVKHLRDVVEGYVEKARKRPEMFSEERLKTIFGNIEDIYMFSATFLADLEKHFTKQVPQLSELGQVFLRYKRGFEIYSEYCNNHPHACEELMELQKNRRYQHFFEACRLLQQMMEIPLEGFLLTPVQKICKYPLQLKELLKYTRSEHPDHNALEMALESMKQIAVLINERKRKMESIERLAEWQESVDDWQGPDLLETSSELIYSGELSKVNSGGWHQERVFFLFDHQLIYCKKDLLWRDMMVFKGRINTDNCVVHPIQDGKDVTFNVNVKHAFKIYDHVREKWYLMYCRNGAERERWLRAFQEERNRCKQDKENGFRVHDFRRHLVVTPSRQSRAHPRKHKGKLHKHNKDVVDQSLYDEEVYAIPSHVTLPRQAQGQGHTGKRSWFPFRKVKR